MVFKYFFFLLEIYMFYSFLDVNVIIQNQVVLFGIDCVMIQDQIMYGFVLMILCGLLCLKIM